MPRKKQPLKRRKSQRKKQQENPEPRKYLLQKKW